MRRVIQGEWIETEFKEVLQSDLKFYYQNPRVYSVLRTKFGNNDPSQEEIFELMSKHEHVRELKKDIKKAGALKEPVIVNINTMEVVEGNSRLAAYRLLYDEDPMQWSEISCEILPENITLNQIDDIIVAISLSRKRNDWGPVEIAKWLWRLSFDENKTTEQLTKTFGWSSEKIKTYISTYQLMLENNLTDHSQFSHWLTLKTNKHIKKLKKDFPQLDQVIIEKVKSGEINKAVMIRDELPIIANAPKKLVRKFVEGEITFQEALKIVEELGPHNTKN